MVHWAEVGVILADAVVARTCSAPLQDSRAAVWSQRGNSLRKLAHFPEAEISLSVAEEALTLGSGDPEIAALLWEFRGLCTAMRVASLWQKRAWHGQGHFMRRSAMISA
jgi:hypothetical protein